MVHNHVNVLSSQTILREGHTVIFNLSLILDNGLSHRSGLVGKLLSLSLGKARVAVLIFELSEDSEGLSELGALENLGVVNDINGALSLSKGNTGDTCELLHA